MSNANKSQSGAIRAIEQQPQITRSGVTLPLPAMPAMPVLARRAGNTIQTVPFTASALPPLTRRNESSRVFGIGFAYDESSSMNSGKRDAAAKAGQAAERELAAFTGRRIRKIEVGFDDSARLITDATPVSASAGLPRLRNGGSTNITAALTMLHAKLIQLRDADLAAGLNPKQLVLLLSDGGHNVGSPPDDAAEDMRRDGIVLVTVGFGEDADFAALERFAFTPRHAYRAYDGAALVDFFREFGRTTVAAANGGNFAQAFATI